MKQLFRYTIFLLIMAFNDAAAQFPDSTKGWSIQDCFRYAAEHNIQVSTLRLTEQSSFQDLYLAKGARIPGLSASAGTSFNNANNTANANGGLVNQLTGNSTYTINSSVVLWNDNYINNNIRQKELLARSTELSVQQSLNTITLSITGAYLDILLAKENLRYITELVGNSEAKVQQGQMLYDAGSIARKDLLQMQAQLATDKFLLVQVQNAIRQNLLSLKQLLQLPADTLFNISTPDSVIVAMALIPLPDVQLAARRDFPEISIGKLRVDIASLEIAKAKAGFKPVISTNAALGTGYSDVITNSVSPKTSAITQTGNNFYQRLGLTVSIPIFSNRINKTNLAKAGIAYKQSRLNLQNDELVLSQAVERAYLDAMNAVESYVAAAEQLKSATESYRIVNEQFRLGSVNTYDLLQQRNQYVQAVQAFIQAKYTAVLQQKIYEFYMGRPVTL